MEVLIITGMSGAGKTSVLNRCQDSDYYTLDNLPPKLIKDVITLLMNSKQERRKLALVIDIRGGEFFDDLYHEVDNLKAEGVNVQILFIDAKDDTLLKRYKELRRPHPQGKGNTIENAIKLERKALDKLKSISDHYLDTTNMNLIRLSYSLGKILGDDSSFSVQVISFGFKYGILSEADFVFDVRFIENPFYLPELKSKTGLDEEVSRFVLEKTEVKDFIERVESMLLMLLPNFELQGKTRFVIGIGCTGGKHRSVAISEELSNRLNDKNIRAEIFHRDQNMW